MRRPGFLLTRRLAQRRQAQRKARTSGEPRPSFWQRLDAGFARARAWALSTVVLVAVGLLGWAIGEELARNPVIIEPLLVPESVAKAGWSGEALARQMRDRIREINEGATTFRHRDSYLFEREQVDIVLPGGLVSIRTLVTMVRGVLGRPARRVTAEVIEFDGRKRPAECDPMSGLPPRYVLVGRLSTTSRGWVICGDAVRELPRSAADALMLAANPYVFASYQSRRDPSRAQAIAEGILRDKYARKDHPWALLLLGYLMNEKKNFAGAIGKYEQAIRLDPNLAAAYVNWGNALFGLKRSEEAIGKYEQAIRLDPNLADAYINWGIALSNLKRPEEAISKYEQAIRLDPNLADAYINWGIALSDLKRPEAIRKYEQAIRLNPNDALAYYNWGNALFGLKRPEEAIGKYEQAIQLDPNLASAYNNCSLVLDSLGRTEEAAAMRATAECLWAGKSVESCTMSGAATGGGGAAAPGK